MHSRCPASTYVGVGLLRGWNWLISERGYANIVPAAAAHSVPTLPKGDITVACTRARAQILTVRNESPSTTAVDTGGLIDPNDNHLIYGLVYALSAKDEMFLDGYEGLPWAYTKEQVAVTIWDADKVVGGDDGRPVDVLVYIDTLRTGPGDISAEYLSRMRRGVQEAGEQGVPLQWMKETFGKWFDSGID